MRNLKKCLYGLTLAILLISCGDKPKNPTVPEVRADTNEVTGTRTTPDKELM